MRVSFMCHQHPFFMPKLHQNRWWLGLRSLRSRLRWAWGSSRCYPRQRLPKHVRRRPCSLVPPQSPDPTTTAHSAPRSQLFNRGCAWKGPGTRPPQISEARTAPAPLPFPFLEVGVRDITPINCLWMTHQNLCILAHKSLFYTITKN